MRIISLNLNGIRAFNCDIAVDSYDQEGVYVSDFNFVAVNTGIKWRVDSAAKLHLLATDGHMSTFVKGIDGIKASQSSIDNILFYARPERTVASHTQMDLNDCDFLRITLID